MTELMDIRIQHHIANEIYRQQMLQRLPDPYPAMLPVPPPSRQMHHIPPRYGLPGANAKLQNDDLWSQFHQVGTEMIITKSGRRMFPSLRIALSGLDEDANYCVLLEMVPIGDCRYKFSGSQWVPAGGAEPQSTQRMYLHPDSPALGSHWQTQPVLFNKVKLTNNTLDSCGHIVLTSMHKYQPRLHIVRTSEPGQIPWAPQQGFSFAETEFVAVTAYQNDRITKLKIDNNPFAKGFRETGQSRCKRKLTTNGTTIVTNTSAQHKSINNATTTATIMSPVQSSKSSIKDDTNNSIYDDSNSISDRKRKRTTSFDGSMSSLDDSGLSISESCSSSSGMSSPATIVDDTTTIIRHYDEDIATAAAHQRQRSLQQHYQQEMILQQFRENVIGPQSIGMNPAWIDLAYSYLSRSYPSPMIGYTMGPHPFSMQPHHVVEQRAAAVHMLANAEPEFVQPEMPSPSQLDEQRTTPRGKKCNFTISAILGCDS